MQTGAPIALMSANLVNSMRTGAIAGLAAKHLLQEGEVIGIIGVTMGRTTLQGLLEVIKTVRK